MLKSLTIKNYALIKDLEMMPASRLNIITGETGAGKSIMLGAVGLLLGNRADSKVLMEENEKCIVEGQFDVSMYDGIRTIFDSEELDYEDECIIRREISPSGKSRAFVNDTPVTLDTLKSLGSRLMDVHSQHETLLLADSTFQLNVIDAYANCKSELVDYKQKYNHFKQTKAALTQLQTEADRLKEEADYHQFLFDELFKAQLNSTEQEELESELDQLENAEDIKAKLFENLQALDNEQVSILDMLHTVDQNMHALSKFGEHFHQLAERLKSAVIEIQDIQLEMDRISDQIVHDPGKTEQVRERLSLIYHLQQKHKVDSIAGLLSIQQSLDEKLQKAANLEEELERLQTALSSAEKAINIAADVLSAKRAAVIAPIIKEMKALLQDLGMPDASIEISNQKTKAGTNGQDDIQFLFSANKGVSLQTLKQVASGGEFSRLMFCFKYILADKTKLPTIVFDEIDTGISGEIALKMVNMMRKMAENHQVIAISHLPQIAAKGHAHFYVYKDNSSAKTASKIKQLTDNERIVEIAKMIGGENYSDSAVQSARELSTFI